MFVRGPNPMDMQTLTPSLVCKRGGVWLRRSVTPDGLYDSSCWTNLVIETTAFDLTVMYFTMHLTGRVIDVTSSGDSTDSCGTVVQGHRMRDVVLFWKTFHTWLYFP